LLYLAGAEAGSGWTDADAMMTVSSGLAVATQNSNRSNRCLRGHAKKFYKQQQATTTKRTTDVMTAVAVLRVRGRIGGQERKCNRIAASGKRSYY
jgi:hypothetical protein